MALFCFLSIGYSHLADCIQFLISSVFVVVYIQTGKQVVSGLIFHTWALIQNDCHDVNSFG